MENKVIKVSDWSQPIKIALFCMMAGYFIWWSLQVLELLRELK